MAGEQCVGLVIAIIVAVAAYLSSVGFVGNQYCLGIDLGTTYSVVAVKQGDKVTIIPNHETQKLLTPSVVSYMTVKDWLKSKDKGVEKDGWSSVDADLDGNHPIFKDAHTDPIKARQSESWWSKIDEWMNRRFGTVQDRVPKWVLVGGPAEGRREKYPKETIFHAKRFIGKSLSEVENEIITHPFAVGNPGITEGSTLQTVSGGVEKIGVNGTVVDVQPGKKVKLAEEDAEDVDREEENARREQLYYRERAMFYVNDRWISPVDVGAAVVGKMREAAEKYLGHPVFECVVTVPTKFNKQETERTLDAFRQAGFKVRRVLEEPTAAAIAYGLHKSAQGVNILVYDLGGGTLDASVLFMSAKATNVLGTFGDEALGGSDFDYEMFKLIQKKCEGTGTTDETLRLLAEDSKKKLTHEDVAEIGCADKTVTRVEFEEAGKELFERSMMPVRKVLHDQMMETEHIDHVVLVGGASRMPKIRTMLGEIFGPEKLNYDIDPDVTVAYGAALNHLEQLAVVTRESSVRESVRSVENRLRPASRRRCTIK